MRIAYLASGAAGMYCGTCLHDNTLAAALLKAGEEVLLIPTYTPLRTDEQDVSQRRVFFGGINVYLQQKSPIFRHTPWCLDDLLDAPGLINWATKHNVSIDPADLGDLTVAMLEGEQGNLRKELVKLVRWLENDVKPDVVHLSNMLLLAMAGEIGRRLRVPIVCSLSGEDVFLERIPEPHYSQVKQLMRQRAGDVAAYTAMNRYYADFMIDYVGIHPERVHVIRHGLNLDGHGQRRPRTAGEPITIGYFARICPDKGLHHLIDAFRLLCEDASLPPIRLHAAGYLAAMDKAYFDEIEGKIQSWGLSDRFSYLGEPDRDGKIALLQSFDMMSVPTDYQESKGLSILEAMANGVPVVLPAHGTFPEMVEDTGGGLLHDPGDAASLAAALKRLILDPALAEELGRSGRAAIHDRYHAEAMAQRTLELYRSLCSPGPGEAAPRSDTALAGQRGA
jgi:glycosyltransferase involved in cell wall biosynthesis